MRERTNGARGGRTQAEGHVAVERRDAKAGEDAGSAEGVGDT